MDELTEQDFNVLLQVMMQSKFQGTDVEYIAKLTKKLREHAEKFKSSSKGSK